MIHAGTRQVMIHRACALLLAPSLLLFAAAATEAAELISVKEAVTRPRLAADYRFNYGPRHFQFGDLRLPAEPGPHPVVVLIHGGCWRANYDLHLMDAMARRLTEIGYVTWNLEYRREGHDTGGWPGTFQDILLGTRYLVNLDTRFDLDLQRVVIAGHSSGGHLALWLAGQPASDVNPVFAGNPLRLLGVVALAPVADLEAVAAQPELGCHDVVEAFMGGSAETRPKRFALASPAQLAGIGIPQIVISGGRDEIIPRRHLGAYVERARERGDFVKLIPIDSAGHFELISPDAPEWSVVERAIKSFTSSVIEH